ncbi:MAG: GntR family transcriptional regulator [Actinobacteria bacterium]|nr:GntR family transcriptional regulator [Actinomycetota bacterium]
MPRIRYLDIADDLRGRLHTGEFGDGRLPSEAELTDTYHASRVTVRKALDALRTEGLVDAQRGLGWFASGDPLRQRLGRLGTIEAQLSASGVTSERKVLELRSVVAPGRVRDVLNVDRVVRLVRLNIADGRPFALVTVWCPESLGGSFSREQLTRHSFHDLLDVPLGHGVQTIAADAATPRQATLLDVAVGSPVLVCRRTTYSVDERAVLFATHVFPGALTEFTVDLPRSDASIAPSGIRLVE